MRCILIPKKNGIDCARLLTLTSPRIKIVKRFILNALEPTFEGKFNGKISVASNKSGYFKKDELTVTV